MPNDGYEAFLANVPKLHSWDKGQTWNTGGFSSATLRILKETIEASLTTSTPVMAETGAGNSTILFLLMNPRRLYSIAPETALWERILAYCAKNGIDHSALEHMVARSEVVLPELAAKLRTENTKLDVALMDGGHGWPTVFIDFCYFNAMLKKGGLLIVDDLQLYSVNEFARWLALQPEYSLVKDMKKTLIWRKEQAVDYLKDFGTQPYIVQQNGILAAAENPFSIT